MTMTFKKSDNNNGKSAKKKLIFISDPEGKRVRVRGREDNTRTETEKRP